MTDPDTLRALAAELCEAKEGSRDDAHLAGWDYAHNGANSTNCHFRHFATPERTKAWEDGRAAALLAMAEQKEREG